MKNTVFDFEIASDKSVEPNLDGSSDGYSFLLRQMLTKFNSSPSKWQTEVPPMTATPSATHCLLKTLQGGNITHRFMQKIYRHSREEQNEVRFIYLARFRESISAISCTGLDGCTRSTLGRTCITVYKKASAQSK